MKDGNGHSLPVGKAPGTFTVNVTAYDPCWPDPGWKEKVPEGAVPLVASKSAAGSKGPALRSPGRHRDRWRLRRSSAPSVTVAETVSTLITGVAKQNNGIGCCTKPPSHRHL